jgi:hypothetical protein
MPTNNTLPKKRKSILGRGVQIVTFIMAAFSGFLTSIAPPDETKANFAVGMVSFGALLVFLFIVVLARTRRLRPLWFVLALVAGGFFLYFAFTYNDDRARLTFLWPPNAEPKTLYVAGDINTLTEKAQKAKREDPNLTPVELVAGFGGIAPDLGIDKRTAVWPAESIRASARKLLLDYVILVLSLATAIFFLTEGLLFDSPPDAAAASAES